jgi:hypothetical protein
MALRLIKAADLQQAGAIAQLADRQFPQILTWETP